MFEVLIVIVPPSRHRITGINRQVQDDQFDLARIGERQRETIRRNSLDVFVAPTALWSSPAHPGDEPIEFDRF